MAFVPITWKHFRNTDAFPNSNDLRKISGVEGVNDADAISSEIIDSAVTNVGIKFTLGWCAGGVVACGLSHDNPNAGYLTIDYCMAYNSNGFAGLQCLENGVEVWSMWGGFIFGPPYRIVINAIGNIGYWAGDTWLYTSTVVPTFPLFADASISCYGTRIFDALIDVGVVAKIDYLSLMGVH